MIISHLQAHSIRSDVVVQSQLYHYTLEMLIDYSSSLARVQMSESGSGSLACAMS